MSDDLEGKEAPQAHEQAPPNEKALLDETDFDALAELHGYHERRAGRVVIDPAEAEREFGVEVARKLKLNKSGTKILWPQPTDDPLDPQNWSNRKKLLHLVVVTMAAVVPDFSSGIGIASLFPLATQFNTTTGHINNLTSNWSIFLLGPGGIMAVMLNRRFGRLPVLFWSQAIGLVWLIVEAVAPNLNTFAAARMLQAVFSTAPQVMGLYLVTDMYPFHLQARMLNAWTMGFIMSPFLSPWLLGYLIAAGKSWRLAYLVGCCYEALVLFLIVVCLEETMFDRHIHPPPPRPTTGLRYRIETLVGLTGWKMRKYRATVSEALLDIFRLVWRPHLLLPLIYVGSIFGFGIGMNVVNIVFVETPPPIGLGYNTWVAASLYATPAVAVVIGELVGRYLNDGVADYLTKRNRGVFESEFRLWTIWVALPIFVAGFVMLGVAFQNKNLSIAAVIFGWGFAELGIMITTVAIYNHASNCFPQHPGEISALVNQARTIGGFAIPYFQVTWATKHGTLQTFGCEAAIIAGLFFLIIPFLQWKGKQIRNKFSMPVRRGLIKS